MSDAQEFLDRVRQDLLGLEERINSLRGHDEEADGLMFETIVDTRSIVSYLERVALASRQFEIAGLCRFVYEGCEEIRAAEVRASNRPPHFELVERELRTKEWLTPTDIGRLTKPVLHPALVNLLLKELGLVVHSAGGWVATKQGLEHGEQRAIRVGRKPFVTWRRSILLLVQKGIEDGLSDALPNPWANSGRRPENA